ncbi:nitrile hydratase accessory protein [Roseomonas marmotae]|uniref:nitrile hydratase accessory protein n=1 Tax=Roseomonas marmotae TaxID=2768161 RepID=UPI001F0174F6|nr:nitrile hydratase accessory protein [Roseomonas marmotae]
MNRSDPVPGDLPGLDTAPDGPVFREPWEAQAFAMAVALHGEGCFGWNEWATALGREIARPGGEGLPYYQHWLAALERLVAEKGILDAEQLLRRREEWREAAEATPHGEPILLR